MIEELLQQEEGKTLEFKENSKSLERIIHTIIAFANTAGGTIVVGVEDKTKKVVGLADPLEDEMRIINKIADSVTPFLVLGNFPFGSNTRCLIVRFLSSSKLISKYVSPISTDLTLTFVWIPTGMDTSVSSNSESNFNSVCLLIVLVV